MDPIETVYLIGAVVLLGCIIGIPVWVVTHSVLWVVAGKPAPHEMPPAMEYISGGAGLLAGVLGAGHLFLH